MFIAFGQTSPALNYQISVYFAVLTGSKTFSNSPKSHSSTLVASDVNKDLTFEAKDKDQTPKDKDQTPKDKDCIVKDKDQYKDCILVLKGTLRRRIAYIFFGPS